MSTIVGTSDSFRQVYHIMEGIAYFLFVIYTFFLLKTSKMCYLLSLSINSSAITEASDINTIITMSILQQCKTLSTVLS